MTVHQNLRTLTYQCTLTYLVLFLTTLLVSTSFDARNFHFLPRTSSQHLLLKQLSELPTHSHNAWTNLLLSFKALATALSVRLSTTAEACHARQPALFLNSWSCRWPSQSFLLQLTGSQFTWFSIPP
jgi:hypothetical protein